MFHARSHRNANDEWTLTQKNKLRGTRDKIAALAEIRSEANADRFFALLDMLLANPFLAQRVFHPVRPATLGRLKSHPVLTPIGTQREISWTGIYLSFFAKDLESFCLQSQAFQTELLLGNYNHAKTHLDKIEAVYGHSLWLLKNRVALLQLDGGLEAQKGYITHIRHTIHAAGVIPYIAYYVSIRNEDTVSADRFISQFDQQLNSLDLPLDLKQYLRFHIAPDLTTPADAIGNILRHEHAGTPIDSYETLIAMARVVVAKDITSLFSNFRMIVIRLARSIDDPRLRSLSISLGERGVDLPPISPAVLDAYDLFFRGRYHESRCLLEKAFESEPSNPALLMLLARARTNSRHSGNTENSFDNSDGSAKLGLRVVQQLVDVSDWNENFEASSSELQKLALNFHGQAWADVLPGVVFREQSYDPLARRSDVVVYGAAASAMAIPESAGMFSRPDIRRLYATKLERMHNGTPVSLYGSALAGLATELQIARSQLAEEEKAHLLTETAITNGGFDYALSLANKTKDSLIYNRCSIRSMCHCYIALGQVTQCIDLMAATLTRDIRLHHILPLREAAASVTEVYHRELRGRPALAIVYYACTRFVGTEYDKYLGIAYEDFLDAHNITKPSLMKQKLPAFNRDQIIFFLTHVCVESVMDRSLEFSSSREVAEERLTVCRLLLEMDSTATESYQSEIREILSRLMVRRRLRDVEQSKIFIDYSGVLKHIDRGLRESFTRYTAYLRLGLDVERSAYKEAVRDKARLGDVQGLADLPLPTSEVSELFQSMVKELLGECVSNTAHGLDGYLSVRIRHGTLSGQIRSPIEAALLITPRNLATGEYERNQYWCERLGGGRIEIEDEVALRLAKFSRAVDELVQQMLRKWIQIKKTPEDVGLFDFVVDRKQFEMLSSFVTPQTSFEEFVDLILVIFNRKLTQSLETIRTTIELQAKANMNDLLTTLQADIASLETVASSLDQSSVFRSRVGRWSETPSGFLDAVQLRNMDVRDFNNAVGSARTNVQVAFDRVIAWFRVSGPAIQEPFSIEDAVRVGMESVRTVSRVVEADVKVISPTNCQLLDGTLLPCFVDVFFIIFENIAKHSGLPGPHQARVEITYGTQSIACHIENDIAVGIANSETSKKLETIRAAMTEARHMSSISIEGGTGFHKISKILTHDVPLSCGVDFGFKESSMAFYVKIIFTVPKLLLSRSISPAEMRT